MKTDEIQKQNSIDLEPFYQALEDDSKLLEDALEILLGMVNFEPESIKKLALFIKEDSRNLYNEISELSKSNLDKGDTSSCCGGH
jgi:predicted transcriptional regulator